MPNVLLLSLCLLRRPGLYMRGQHNKGNQMGKMKLTATIAGPSYETKKERNRAKRKRQKEAKR